MTSSLRDAARQLLDHLERRGDLKRAASLEHIWAISALESILEGRLLEPDIDTLKQLTTKERVWEELKPAWPPDHVTTVIGSVVAAQHLAIVKRDADWLAELHACWETSPEDIHYLLRLCMQGEIGLALAPGGSRPFGWSEEELSWLEEEDFLVVDAPGDRAWRALAKRDLEAARQALGEYEHFLAALPERWEANPPEGLRQILAVPDALFQVERRALAALLGQAQHG